MAVRVFVLACALVSAEATRPMQGHHAHARSKRVASSLPAGAFKEVEDALQQTGVALINAEKHGDAGHAAAQKWKESSYAMLMKNKQDLDDSTEKAIDNLLKAHGETERGVRGGDLRKGGLTEDLLDYAVRNEKRSADADYGEYVKEESNQWLHDHTAEVAGGGERLEAERDSEAARSEEAERERREAERESLDSTSGGTRVEPKQETLVTGGGARLEPEREPEQTGSGSKGLEHSSSETVESETGRKDPLDLEESSRSSEDMDETGGSKNSKGAVN